MKKQIIYSKLFLILPLTFAVNTLLAQLEFDLQKKYWNYREKFQKHFVKIGSLTGYSVNLANIDGNPDNMSYLHGPNPWPSFSATNPVIGYRKTGDAMNMQGDYIAVLATQYNLLKNSGENVEATLNELYYAINAVDRLDAFAEVFFGSQNTNANGFFMRDDVNNDIALQFNNQYPRTLDPRDSYKGIVSDYYQDWNPPLGDVINEMSQDQMLGLMFGFTFVKKFVGHVFVKPTQADNGFFLDDKVVEITNRFMNWITQNRSFNSRQYTILKFDSNLLGVASSYMASPSNYSNVITLNSVCDVTENWTLVHPLTFEKTHDGSEIRPWSYAIAKMADNITNGNYVNTKPIIHNTTDNLFDGSLCVIPHSISLPLDAPNPIESVNSLFWNPIQNLPWNPNDILNSFDGLGHFNIEIPYSWNPLDNTKKYLNLHYNGLKLPRFNVNLSLLLASTTGTWSHHNVNRIASLWQMEIFDLMYAVLNNTTPMHPQSYWQNLLSTAPCEGPYNNRANNGALNYAPGWFDPNKWNGNTDPNSNLAFGEFNGNDYMLLYNLYRIAYANQLANVPFKESSCDCKSAKIIDLNKNGMALSNNITLQRKFPEYLDFGIGLKEYLVSDLGIWNNKQMNVETDLIVCNNKHLAVGSGTLVVGNNNGDSASIIFRSGTKLSLYSDINTPNIKGKLIINNNSKVVIEEGALLHFSEGAEIQLKGDNAVLEIEGKLYIGDNTVFKFTYPGSNSGYIKFSKPGYSTIPYNQITGGINASIELKGKNKNDKILEINQDLLQVAIANGINTFKIEHGTVDFTFTKGMSYISTDASVRFFNSSFKGIPNNPNGQNSISNVAVWGQQQCQITNCEFDVKVGLIGNLFAYGNKLNISNTRAWGGIRTQGKGVLFNTVTSPTFTAELANYNSIANNSKFSDGEGVRIINSPIEFYFNSCKANNNFLSGYEVDGPTLLKIKCGQVKENSFTGFHIAKSAALSMNVTDGGGYVDARDNAFNTIYLDGAHALDIENGYNDLRPYDFNFVNNTQINSPQCTNFANCGYLVIEGTVKQLPSNPILVDNNRWQASTNNTTHPLQTTYNKDKYTRVGSTFTPGQLDNINFTASSQSPRANCDFWNPSCINCPKSFLEICPTCNIISTADFLNVKINEAVKVALAKMDSLNTNPNGNKEAVDLLYQVLKYPLPVPTEGDKYITNIAERKILVALATAIEKGEIPVSSTTLAPEIIKTLEITDSKIFKAIADNNYQHIFNLVLEKVLIYYSAEHRVEALATINQFLPNIQAKDLNYANRLICMITNELQYLNNEISQFEYLKQSEECTPLEKREGTRRTIISSSENNEEEPMLQNSISLYPNPAQDKLFIEFSEQLNSEAKLELYDVTGKKVYEIQLKANNQKTEISNLNLSNGIYFYRISNGEQNLQQGKLSISK